MQHREGIFKGAGELELYYQCWRPSDQRRAILIIVHGLGGHSGLFNNLVDCLVPQGFEIYGFDLRGHGRSPGQRGHLNAWAEFREDLRRFIHWVDAHTPSLPCFLLGHSLGGAIALDYSLHFPNGLQGVIATAPAVGKVGVSPIRMVIGRILSCLWPSFSLDTGIAQGACSRDPAVVEAYAQDPLRHTKGSARLVTEFLTTTAWIQSHIANLQTPVLILHGGADQVTSSEGSCAFFQQITLSDKERREYPESYHELHNDLNHQEVLADLSNWLERHLQTGYVVNSKQLDWTSDEQSETRGLEPSIDWVLASDS
ncbi:MAG: alpha/beta hydrolase [Leptolyngbyaceae cyanobacterium MO_188.B28]|nr:alpha/beta hydrolase [Leptolyngbyaceae cyanobacterium MO_188.B28]